MGAVERFVQQAEDQIKRHPSEAGQLQTINNPQLTIISMRPFSFSSLQLFPPSSPPNGNQQKDYFRELRMSEFLEKATCLQLLCAGEKLNIRSSKVTLVKYNDRVKHQLGVETVIMRL